MREVKDIDDLAVEDWEHDESATGACDICVEYGIPDNDAGRGVWTTIPRISFFCSSIVNRHISLCKECYRHHCAYMKAK